MVITASISAVASQAQAFDLGPIIGVFKADSDYKSPAGLFTVASNLYNVIQKMTVQVPKAKDTEGEQGIKDPTRLSDEALDAFSKEPVDPDNTENVGLKTERLKAAVAAETASAPLTKEGQKKALEEAQEQTNLAEAAVQSAQDTQASTSSLEAIQNSIGASAAMSAQLKVLSKQQMQSNQTQAASAQIQGQIGKEVAAANIARQSEKDDELNAVTKAGAISFPLFYKH